MVKIGIMGDRVVDSQPQATIESALSHAAHLVGVPVSAEWIPTATMKNTPAGALSRFDGLFAAPGGAPEAVDAALEGIRYAREHDAVFVRTCGGFQHAVLEFAKNVAGIAGAAHQDYGPDADALVLTALVCSIAGKAMRVLIDPGSRAKEVFEASETMEEYYCTGSSSPVATRMASRAFSSCRRIASSWPLFSCRRFGRRRGRRTRCSSHSSARPRASSTRRRAATPQPRYSHPIKNP